jgi:hemoglobin
MQTTISLPNELVAAEVEPTLYQRIGSYDGIAGFVDLAFPRVAMHPKLAHLFRGHSMDSQIRQRQLIVDALCHATGGPCYYIGRPMKPVHAGLGITNEHWSIFLQIIDSALDERAFLPAAKRDFLAVFEQVFRADIIDDTAHTT